MSFSPRRILRFCPKGELVAADGTQLTVFDPSGDQRYRVEMEDFLDAAAVGEELWVMATTGLTRLDLRTGRKIATEKLNYIDPNGFFLVSATAPQLPVWHGEQPVALRTEPARTEVPGPGGEMILPLADGRWLLWQAGQLRLWRSIGEAWRKPLGEPGSRPFDAQLVLDGRLFVLAQQRPARAGEDGGELRLSVAAVSDGAHHTHLRLPQVTQLAIAARRGLAAVRSGDSVGVFDLRFGRWIHNLQLPPGVTDLAVNDTLQHIALRTPLGLELVRPDALIASAAESTQQAPAPPVEADAPTNGHTTQPAMVAEAERLATQHRTIDDNATATGADEPADDQPAPEAEPSGDVEQPLPDEPLVRLDPVSFTTTATDGEIAQLVGLQLNVIGSRVGVAIAEGWDSGRISMPDAMKPPFVDEVGGLLHFIRGRASEEFSDALERQREAELALEAAERDHAGQRTPLDVLAQNFQLSPLAVSILFAIAAPRLRGELARLYGILANDPGRPLVDEFLLCQILGPEHAPDIARELDGDRPLRTFGIVRVAQGDRPFAALSVDPLVIRSIANQSLDGEPDPFMTVRTVDRDLEELQMPRAILIKALRFLSTPIAPLAGDFAYPGFAVPDGTTASEESRPSATAMSWPDPVSRATPADSVRIVVRGRTGSGRHTLITSLASRAGRGVGVIDLSTVPREPGRLAATLESVLRRALLRGLVPCVDGLELIGSEDPDTRRQVTAILRSHPGPIALRLPSEANIPLEPGYLLLDLPIRNELERGESWAIALDHHQIDLPDASELAARYRVGPGIIDRVCAEVARRPDPPTDASAWVRELDDAMRQHLENRLGTTARRITRLAKWTDVVLPEDVTDSLLELTARVRHRKIVYEQWGFDRAITTARGITALFSGSPGTGKTMVAGVIARDLGLELYRVDVSRITSKWIGETEKNLGSLFDAAEDGQVMLLFDEADSLFAKRTEVKTSVDRYANMEINYLLQRLDTFEGIAILTTNFGSAIDPAFKRRLTYRVTFPFPDEEMREQLWKSLIPPQTPIAGKIDFASLSQRFRISGGYIRNAALRGAFLAAEEGSALTHEHLERAIRMEFREIGKLAETGTLE